MIMFKVSQVMPSASDTGSLPFQWLESTTTVPFPQHPSGVATAHRPLYALHRSLYHTARIPARFTFPFQPMNWLATIVMPPPGHKNRGTSRAPPPGGTPNVPLILSGDPLAANVNPFPPTFPFWGGVIISKL